MSRYLINDVSIESSDPFLGNHLARAHKSKLRPLCLCQDPGVEMYIARVGEHFIVKRMPNTGSHHDPECESYEFPPELSGLGQMVGSAIQENPEDGVTELKFDFSLSKESGRKAPVPGTDVPGTVKSKGSKLSLRDLLHYLWQEAGFVRWTPAMADKRKWYVIRKHLLQAAVDKVAKGSSLADHLYIPETFSTEKKDEIARRRMASMSKISPSSHGPRRLMMLIGELKEITQGRFGHKVIIKHLPDFHFSIDDKFLAHLVKRFKSEFALWNALENTHLIIVATFGMDITGVVSLEEAAVMNVTENWIPFESVFEKDLIEVLRDRQFIKGLRYKLPPEKPLASLVLSDTRPEPTALYLVPQDATEEYTAAMESLITESRLSSWVWSTGQEDMPPIPELPA